MGTIGRTRGVPRQRIRRRRHLRPQVHAVQQKLHPDNTHVVPCRRTDRHAARYRRAIGRRRHVHRRRRGVRRSHRKVNQIVGRAGIACRIHAAHIVGIALPIDQPCHDCGMCCTPGAAKRIGHRCIGYARRCTVAAGRILVATQAECGLCDAHRQGSCRLTVAQNRRRGIRDRGDRRIHQRCQLRSIQRLIVYTQFVDHAAKGIAAVHISNGDHVRGTVSFKVFACRGP